MFDACITFARMTKRIVLYGVLMAVMVIALRLAEYKLVIIDHSLELYGMALAVVFTLAGIWAGRKLTGKPHTRVVEVQVERTVYLPQAAAPSGSFVSNAESVAQLGISPREMEILELMAAGLSNKEIAEQLYISLSTVKTHSSNLFTKLDVNRRTLAVKKAKELSLIP